MAALRHMYMMRNHHVPGGALDGLLYKVAAGVRAKALCLLLTSGAKQGRFSQPQFQCKAELRTSTVESKRFQEGEQVDLRRTASAHKLIEPGMDTVINCIAGR